MKIEIENKEVVIETTYRKKTEVTLTYSMQRFFREVPIENLIAGYVACVMARTIGSEADKKDAPPTRVVNWTEGGEEIPIFHGGPRKGKPTELDIQRAEAIWALPDGGEVDAKLQGWVEFGIAHEWTYDTLNDADDPEAILARLCRLVRLESIRRVKLAEKSQF